MYANTDPQSSSPSSTAGSNLSHLAPGVHASMILGQFSPVATLRIDYRIYKVRNCDIMVIY